MDALWLVNIFWLGILTIFLLIFILVLAFKIYNRLGQLLACCGGKPEWKWPKPRPVGDDPLKPPDVPPPPPPPGG